MIPGFGPGQGIVSGQVVRFPLPVRVKMDEELLASEIGDEDFFEQAAGWRPDAHASTRTTIGDSIAAVNRNRQKRETAATGRKTAAGSRRRGRPRKAAK